MKGKNITIVVGTGAVENSWEPVIRAINKTYGISTNNDGANFLMAREIYQLRAYSIFAQRDHYPEAFSIMRSNVEVLKQNIANELRKAQESGELKPRPLLKNVITKFANEALDKMAVVSANWDEVVETEVKKLFNNIGCLHIHGSISNPSMLYLPSEITLESYRIEKEENRIAHDHMNLMSLLQNSNKTILYGISLDPLDAELNVSLAAGWDSRESEEIIIINPKHKVVSERVKLLLDKKTSIKIIGYNPMNLNDKFEYT